MLQTNDICYKKRQLSTEMNNAERMILKMLQALLYQAFTLKTSYFQRLKNGAPGEIRTHDLRLRRATLYPAELRAHNWRIVARKATDSNCSDSLALYLGYFLTQFMIQMKFLYNSST